MGFTFIEPGTVRLDLGDGDWIEVKRELSAGELKAMRTSSFTYMQGQSGASADDEVKIGVDWRRLAVARILSYVIDWNAKDAQGRPVPFSRAAVEQLSVTDFERLEATLNTHAVAIEALKNSKAGETKSEAS